MYSQTQGKGNVKTPLTLTSTVNSFIVAVFTIACPVAQFVEVDAFFCPGTLYVIQGTSDHHLSCTYSSENKKTNIYFNIINSCLLNEL